MNFSILMKTSLSIVLILAFHAFQQPSLAQFGTSGFYGDGAGSSSGGPTNDGGASNGGNDHIHDLHPVAGHGSNNHWNRISLEENGYETPIVKLDSSGFERIFSEWLVNSTCTDGVERGNEYTSSVTHEVHVGGGVELAYGYEAAASILAAEIKTTASVKVNLNGGWKGTWNEELKFSSKFSLAKCQKIWYYFGKTKKTASGSIVAYQHRITCRCSHGDTDINYCGKNTLSGNGVGWGDHWGEHVQRGLIDPCPCRDKDINTTYVLEPAIEEVEIIDPSGGNGAGGGHNVTPTTVIE